MSLSSYTRSQRLLNNRDVCEYIGILVQIRSVLLSETSLSSPLGSPRLVAAPTRLFSDEVRLRSGL